MKDYIVDSNYECDVIRFYDDDRTPFEILNDMLDAWKGESIKDYQIIENDDNDNRWCVYITTMEDEVYDDIYEVKEVKDEDDE